MRRMRTIAGRFIAGLLGVALALSPVAAIDAATSPAEQGSQHVAMPNETPCDIPCDGCADKSPSPSCMSVCMGLVAAIPLFDSVPIPNAFSERAPVPSQTVLSGALPEPDTPPPRSLLA